MTLSSPLGRAALLVSRRALLRQTSLSAPTYIAGPSRLYSVPAHGRDEDAVSANDHAQTTSRASATGTAASETDELDFEGWDHELRRRMRKVNAKRRQRGADFVDHLLVTVRGGKGGPGAAALAPSHRGSGPPCGGNGGGGGSVYLRTNAHLTSLARVGKRYIGEQGGGGAGAYKNGKRGGDVIIDVPVGTIVRELRREGPEVAWMNEDAGLDAEAKRRKRWDRRFLMHPAAEANDEELRAAEDTLRREGFFRRTPTPEEEELVLMDISAPVREPILLAQGGRGGLGNPHFQLPNRPPCRLAARGAQPPTHTFALELKLLADVGLVGLPNAGKSTLLNALTARKAEVAGYSFTTLNPQVGVVRVYDDGTWGGAEGVVEESEVERARTARARAEGEYMPTPTELREMREGKGRAGKSGDRVESMRFTISDNPGLLPLASENVGLGHSFLRSIERSLALVYVLDLSRADPAGDVRTLRHELEEYKEGLAERAVAVVLNKADEVGEEDGRERVQKVKEEVGEGCEVLVMSGKYGLGVERLVTLLSAKVAERREGGVGEGPSLM